MWRAVLRSMYSSGTKPLTSAAILVSKPVVSKWVMVFTPETPSIMFDHTVSTSLPIGVMKPMPVTATRRPLELEVMRTAYGPQGQCPSAWCGKKAHLSWTPWPSSLSEQLAELQGELQPQAGRRDLEVSPQDLAQLAEAGQDGVAVPLSRRGGLLVPGQPAIAPSGVAGTAAVAEAGLPSACPAGGPVAGWSEPGGTASEVATWAGAFPPRSPSRLPVPTISLQTATTYPVGAIGMLSASACFCSSSSESKLSLIRAWKRRAWARVPRCMCCSLACRYVFVTSAATWSSAVNT